MCRVCIVFCLVTVLVSAARIKSGDHAQTEKAHVQYKDTTMKLTNDTDSSGCKSGHTCCFASLPESTFEPSGFSCVEDEPGFFGSNNCGRADLSKVSGVMRLLWRHTTFCTDTSPIVTRTELEAKEEKEREWQEGYKKWCINNDAKCSSTETCFYDKRSSTAGHAVTDMGPACVCMFKSGKETWEFLELGRENTDGTGKCVECAEGPSGQFVPNPDPSSDIKLLLGHNDEFVCAHGAKKPAV